MGAEEGEGTGRKINLTIKFPNRDDMALIVKPTTPFSKIYAAVGKAMGVGVEAFVLNWDEVKLMPTESKLFYILLPFSLANINHYSF